MERIDPEEVLRVLRENPRIQPGVEIRATRKKVGIYVKHKYKDISIEHRLYYAGKTWNALKEQLSDIRGVRGDFRTGADDYILQNKEDIEAIFSSLEGAADRACKLREYDECERCKSWILKPFDVYVGNPGAARCVHCICVNCWLELTHCPTCNLPYF